MIIEYIFLRGEFPHGNGKFSDRKSLGRACPYQCRRHKRNHAQDKALLKAYDGDKANKKNNGD